LSGAELSLFSFLQERSRTSPTAYTSLSELEAKIWYESGRSQAIGHSEEF